MALHRKENDNLVSFRDHRRKRWSPILVLLILIIILSCVVIPTPPALKTTITAVQVTTQIPATSEPPVSPPAPQVEKTANGPTPLLEPFPSPAVDFAGIELLSWGEENSAGASIELPISLDQISNKEVADGLTNSQRAFLAQNGFVIMHSQEEQFGDIRDRVARYYGQPYYLTTDAAYHAVHLSLDELLKALEREELRPRMLLLTNAVLEEVLSYIPNVQGTALEPDMKLAAAYLSVALRLFNPDAEVDPEVEPLVAKQISQIVAAQGKAKSAMFPDFEDDYGAYRPVGHYAGDAALESYYQAMTWYGRVHFILDPLAPADRASRLPLIITLALRRAAAENGAAAAQEWTTVNDILTFLIGKRDDYGPVEYAALMDQVYGDSVSLQDLAEEPDWITFRRLGSELPPPRINSTFVDWLDQLEAERGWRFMGQRFSLDAFIMGNLVFDRVGTLEERRELPSGLDVMAALGSPAAGLALDEVGATAYQNYPEQMAALQSAVQQQVVGTWLGTAYDAWLYAYEAQVSQKGEAYPATMRTAAWSHKELNSALGSWAELKHDTSLYVKMPEAAGGGGPPSSGPPPCFVEENPNVFYRLAYLSSTIVEGLIQRSLEGGEVEDGMGLSEQLSGLLDLSDRLGRLGDLAAKELTGEPLDQDDCALVTAPLGPVEARVHRSQMMGAPLEMPPAPVISAVAGAGERVLQVAVGLIDRIYVAVDLGDEVHIAQGGVFSYYEFPRLRAERLSDEVWRSLLTPSNPEMPPWTANFLLPGGAPVDVLAFRIGDTYRITSAGGKLSMRASASLNASLVYQLEAGEYVIIVDGPIQAAGFTWWKLQLALDSSISAWAVENPDWYERAWGQ